MLVAVAVLIACSRPTEEQRIVNDAAEALGGRDRILAVKTLVLEGEGTEYTLGLDVTPTAHGQTYTLSPYRRTIDIASGHARTEETRTANFPWFVVPGQPPEPQVEAIDGTVGYNIGASGRATRTNDAVSTDRRLEFLQHPLVAVRAALEPGAMLANARTEAGESLVDVTLADGRTFTLVTNAATKLPTRIVMTGHNDVLGDVTLQMRVTDYGDVSGLQLPARLTSATDDFVTTEIRAATQTVDAEIGNLAVPADAGDPPPAFDAPPPTVSVEEIVKGVWVLGGNRGSNAVVVEFGDHLKLIEAPPTEARTLAYIAKARELRPEKPLTHVINTHHHFDHLGGIRAAISEGLTVITHDGNAALIREVAERPHTLVPDALSRNPRPLMLEAVSEDTVLSDSAMTLHLIRDSSVHSETMLFAYVPRDRLLIVTDVYNNPQPGSRMQPYARELLQGLERRKLRVDRVLPLHGVVVLLAQVVRDTVEYEKLIEAARE